MDPLSIAAAAASLSATCFKLANTIYEYVEEVKHVDHAISLFGKDLKTLSQALQNVDIALKDNAAALITTLGGDIKLLDSLEACIQDCGETVQRIGEILEETQTHGRVGNAIRRPATHWKLKDKKQELGLLRARVISFHTAMNMSLQMIHICIILHVQINQESQHDDVLKGIDQLRRQIKKLTKMSQGNDSDSESLPATVQQCLDSAIALDTSASTAVDDIQSSILGAMTQAPSDKVQGWMQNSHSFEPPISNLALTEISEGDEKSTLGPSVSLTNVPSKVTEDTSIQSLSHLEWSRAELQKSRDLSEAGRPESAKSLCRKVIHESEFTTGTNSPGYRDGILLLAGIHEENGDESEANEVRELLRPQRRVEMRNQFKKLLQEKNPEACIEFALKEAALLHHIKSIRQYRQFVSKLLFDIDFFEANILIVLAATGNSVLVQLMLSRGASLDTKVEIEDSAINTVTALSCAVYFKHKYLVATILEYSPESATTDLSLVDLETSILKGDIQMLRLIFDHMPNHSGAKDVRNDCMKRLLSGRHFKIARCLFENGASTTIQFDEHHTMLRHAVESSDYDLAEVLLKHGAPSLAEANLNNGKPIITPWVSSGEMTMAKCLPLQRAVFKGDLKMTSLLLQYGATRCLYPISKGPVSDTHMSPNFDPVHFAVKNESLEMLKLLVTESVHISSVTAELAIQSSWVPGMDHFESINPSYIPSTRLQTLWEEAAILAIKLQLLGKLQRCVTEKAHVTRRTVHEACSVGWATGLNHLLSIDSSHADAALLIGCGTKNRNTEVLQVALSFGGDPNYEQHTPRQFPLEQAAKKGYSPNVSFLLLNGARVDKYHMKDPSRRTALYSAVEITKELGRFGHSGYLQVISRLVQAGASTDQVTVKGVSVLNPRRRKITAALRGEY
ncbi:hypothetical protein ACN42_g11631 [Penicillium freii]|uniref:Fungal N-terminal domain-containing protein n=1 Tax=Penicillium freii TaxID=48697 RepID=A0A101M821_PENFR|nr:hypothetical protein ACN42_g11631 [Penicillium freii]